MLTTVNLYYSAVQISHQSHYTELVNFLLPTLTLKSSLPGSSFRVHGTSQLSMVGGDEPAISGYFNTPLFSLSIVTSVTGPSWCRATHSRPTRSLVVPRASYSRLAHLSPLFRAPSPWPPIAIPLVSRLDHLLSRLPPGLRFCDASITPRLTMSQICLASPSRKVFTFVLRSYCKIGRASCRERVFALV